MDVNDKIVYSDSGKLLAAESIIRIEEIASDTFIFLIDSSKAKSVLSIDELEWELPKDVFLRVHPNHLINRNYSKKKFTINTQWIELNDGKKIPISEELADDKKLFKKGNSFFNWIKKLIK